MKTLIRKLLVWYVTRLQDRFADTAASTWYYKKTIRIQRRIVFLRTLIAKMK